MKQIFEDSYLLIREKGKLKLLKPEKWYLVASKDDNDYYEIKPYNGCKYIPHKTVIGEIKNNKIHLVRKMFVAETKTWEPMRLEEDAWVEGLEEDVSQYLISNNIEIKTGPPLL